MRIFVLADEGNLGNIKRIVCIKNGNSNDVVRITRDLVHDVAGSAAGSDVLVVQHGMIRDSELKELARNFERVICINPNTWKQKGNIFWVDCFRFGL
jgi:hypothetical protein